MKRLMLVLAACGGPSSSELASDITNSTPASAAARPYAATLQIVLQNGASTSCSGALVSPNRVLTAAHCTVCAASISVKMLGAATVHATTEAIEHPEAFPDQQVDCQLQFSDAEDKINVGADLAVVPLQSPSQVTPISALITPPYGWDPVTELEGPGAHGVTIVGRATGDMRQGDATLAALSPAPHPACDFLPATSTQSYLQLWGTDDEAAMQDGDSGGPMIATFWGTPKVIGVASWYCNDEISYYPPTFVAENAPFLASAIGLYPPGGDSDGDHVLDVADNCAQDGNPQQQDGDEDGVGDACDGCPEDPDHEQDNCNVEAEVALGAQRRGDACDPTPCARIHTRWGPVPTSQIPAPFPQPCAANGYGIAACHWEMPTGFVVHPVGAAGSAVAPGAIGLRHCRCTASHASAGEREAACRSPSNWSCDVDGTLFPSGLAPWRAMAVPASTPVMFGPGGNPGVPIAWDSTADLEALGTGSLPPPPWSPDANGFVGTAKLDGIVWAHVISRAGTPTASMGSLDGVPYVDLANTYAVADHRFRLVYHWRDIPQYAPAWPWEYCARCQLELPWVSVIDPERRVVLGIGPDGARQLDLAPELSDLLARGRVLTAVEPAGILERAGVMRRAIVVDASGAAIGALSARDGVSAEPLRSPALRGTDSMRLFAYSALRGEAFALRLAPGATTARLERLTSDWAPVALAGVALGVPLAITMQRDALHVVDRVGSAIRLVRVDLIAGHATVISPRLLSATPRAIALSITPAGELLVMAGTELAWIAGDRLVGRATSRDELAGDARQLATGVHFAGRDGAGIVPMADRRAPGGSGIAPVF